MLTRTPLGEVRFRLPRRRRVSRSLFRVVVLPAALVAVLASGNCAKDNSKTERTARVADDPFPVSFETLTLNVAFPDADGTEIAANKQRLVLARITYGMDTLYPAGTITIGGTATAGSVGGAKLPRKVDIELDAEAQTAAGRAQIFKSTVKIKRGTLTQGNSGFGGVTLTPTSPLKLMLKPKGGAITNDQTYSLNVTYAPTTRALIQALDAYGALRASTLATGYALLRQLPLDGASVPILVRPGATAKANAKMDALRIRSGAAFSTGDMNVTLAGGFFGGGPGELPRPTSAKVFVVVRDAQGNRKSSTTFKLKINGNNVPPVTKLIRGLDIEPDDVLDVKYSPKGGDIEPDDNFFIVLSVATPS